MISAKAVNTNVCRVNGRRCECPYEGHSAQAMSDLKIEVRAKADGHQQGSNIIPGKTYNNLKRIADHFGSLLIRGDFKGMNQL